MHSAISSRKQLPVKKSEMDWVNEFSEIDQRSLMFYATTTKIWTATITSMATRACAPD
jgi:hypothetical protein